MKKVTKYTIDTKLDEMTERVKVVMSSWETFDGWRSTLRAYLQRGYAEDKKNPVTWAMDIR